MCSSPRSMAIRISTTPIWYARSLGISFLSSTFQPCCCNWRCPSLPRMRRLSVQTFVSRESRYPPSTSLRRRFCAMFRLTFPKCHRWTWEVSRTWQAAMVRRIFLSRLVILVIVGLREFRGQSAGITPAYPRYLAAEGTHLEEMPAVRERTGAAPESDQGNGGAACAQDLGSGCKLQELDMAQEAEETREESPWQGHGPAGKEQHILAIHTFTPC